MREWMRMSRGGVLATIACSPARPASWPASQPFVNIVGDDSAFLHFDNSSPFQISWLVGDMQVNYWRWNASTQVKGHDPGVGAFHLQPSSLWLYHLIIYSLTWLLLRKRASQLRLWPGISNYLTEMWDGRHADFMHCVPNYTEKIRQALNP